MSKVQDALASPLMTSICMLRQFVRQKLEGDRSGKDDKGGASLQQDICRKLLCHATEGIGRGSGPSYKVAGPSGRKFEEMEF